MKVHIKLEHYTSDGVIVKTLCGLTNVSMAEILSDTTCKNCRSLYVGRLKF